MSTASSRDVGAGNGGLARKGGRAEVPSASCVWSSAVVIAGGSEVVSAKVVRGVDALSHLRRTKPDIRADAMFFLAAAYLSERSRRPTNEALA